jgi:hypothetical protein
MQPYTKNGLPLQVFGDIIYSRSGKVVGRMKNEKVFGTDGHYVGTLVTGRLVHRSTDSACMSSPFTAANRLGSAAAHAVGSALMGDEPDIPD